MLTFICPKCKNRNAALKLPCDYCGEEEPGNLKDHRPARLSHCQYVTATNKQDKEWKKNGRKKLGDA